MTATTKSDESPRTGRAKLLTVAEFDAMPDEIIDGRETRYELDDGVRVRVPLPDCDHGRCSAAMIYLFHCLGDCGGFGRALGRVTVIIRRDPDRVVVTDGTFLANSSLPPKLSAEDFLETVPDLVVEIRARAEPRDGLERKAAEYLAAGGKLVWLLDPVDGNATVFAAGQPPRTLGPHDELTAEAIIPGLRVTVADALSGELSVLPPHPENA